jgi:hypothetical protein
MPGIEARAPEQRIFAIAEFLAGDAADFLERGLDLRLEALRIGFAVLVKMGAEFGGDGEAGRHRQAEMRHLGETRALAAEKVAHAGAGFRFAAAEGIDPFALRGRLRRRGFGRGLALAGRGFLHRLTGLLEARFDHDIIRLGGSGSV